MRRVLIILAFLACQLAQGQQQFFELNKNKNGYDTDAVKYFNNVATAGYIMTDNEKRAVSDFCKSLKNNALWSKIYDCGPTIGGTSATHLVTLKGIIKESSFHGTLNQTSTGFQATVAGSYLYINVIPSSVLTLGDTHLAVYSRTSAAGSSTSTDMVSGSSSSEMGIYIRRSINQSYSAAYNENTSQGFISTTVSDGSGLFISTRTSTRHGYFRNGSALASQTTTGGSLPSTAIGLGASLSVPSTYNSLREYCYWSIGSGLTDSDVSTYSTIVNTLETALGRNTY